MDDDQEAPPPLSDKETKDLVGKIQSVLTPDLLKPKYRKMSEGEHPTFGHCGSATQAAYYMLGGEESGYVPQVANLGDGTTHWWLRHRDTGHVIDPTKEQFTSKGKKPPYDRGRGCGFPNPNPDVPSKRGQEIINRIRGRAARASGGSVDESDIASPPPAEETGIDAYHGSPHEFEQFDSSKIGTGEGAQAYGHGLYFAEHEPIAKGYRDRLSQSDVQIGKYFYDPAALMHYLENPKSLDDEIRKNYDILERNIKLFERNNRDFGEAAKAIDLIEIDKLEQLKKIDLSKINIPKGHMYEVRINAHPDHFLDWDKPLSEHKPEVQKALSGLDPYVTSSGEKIWKELSKPAFASTPTNTPKEAADWLRKQGIVGIKYLDAGSRREGKGTHNYVVFDDKLINIKRRYEMGGAVPMASGGETGDTQNMPQGISPEQQSLLDQLSRAIDESVARYSDGHAGNSASPARGYQEPTMPGEPSLTRQQEQDYNINRLQDALNRVPAAAHGGAMGYAEGGDVENNPAVQKALSLTSGVNTPALHSTFGLENRPSAIVSPRPGKGGGPPITHRPENFDPSLVTDQEPWTYSTPDIIGASKPPPVQHPVFNEPRMKNITRHTAKIFNNKNFAKIVKEITGLEGVTATPTVGTWQKEMEPSFIIHHPEMTSDHAKALAHLLGFGFQQDAAVHTWHNDSTEDGIPALLIGNGNKLTNKDIDRIAKLANHHGIDFTVTADGKAAKFLHFGDEKSYHDFADKVGNIADSTGMSEKYHAKTQGDLIYAKDYLNGIFGKGGGSEGVQASPERSPDLFRRIVDHILAPYSKAVASEGYRLSPERLQEAYGLTDDEAEYVRKAMRPSGRADRTTIPLMTGKEKLDIRPTGSRGQPTVEDALYALQNRAAAKGQIDPGDYSKQAMNKIASDIAEEVKYHMDSSNAGNQKSAIGWYDSALKAAMGKYTDIFPQLLKNQDDKMLFHAILGITSQGNDVYSNSINAARVFSLMKNQGMSLPNAVKKLSGTFGAQTNAIEQNLLKLHHLLNTNGFNAMRSFFNNKTTVSQLNSFLRKNPQFFGPSGNPLEAQGKGDQIVSGWSVFGPKIGSFINNLHGDYSTLTADLWFSRTWNRLLGHNFVHTPITEAKQYRDLRDAMTAEHAYHNGLPAEQAPYTKNGKIDTSRNWLHGSDLKDMNHDEFKNLINDPEAVLNFAKDVADKYADSGYKDKSDVRRRAKNWIENREKPVEAPRGDEERAFQQNTAELAQKLIKKRYGVDISIADIQAALWFHEKELFDKLGVSSKKTKPADYVDAADQTIELMKNGQLFQAQSKKRKAEKASGGSVVDQALRLVSKYKAHPDSALSMSKHLIQRGRP